MPATRDDAAEGINALYAQHYLALVRLARHLVDDLESAEDVVQDVFAALSRRLAPDDALRYLRTAIVNRSRSVLRRRKVSRAFAARATLTEMSEAADADTLRADRRRTVLAAIDALPRRQREVVVLRYYEDLRVAEISAVLGITASAVSASASLSRALDALEIQIGTSVPYLDAILTPADELNLKTAEGRDRSGRMARRGRHSSILSSVVGRVG